MLLEVLFGVLALAFLSGCYIRLAAQILAVVLPLVILLIDGNLGYWHNTRKVEFWNQMKLIGHNVGIFGAVLILATDGWTPQLSQTTFTDRGVCAGWDCRPLRCSSALYSKLPRLGDLSGFKHSQLRLMDVRSVDCLCLSDGNFAVTRKRKKNRSFPFCKLIIYSDSCLHFLFVLCSETWHWELYCKSTGKISFTPKQSLKWSDNVLQDMI